MLKQQKINYFVQNEYKTPEKTVKTFANLCGQSAGNIKKNQKSGEKLQIENSFSAFSSRKF